MRLTDIFIKRPVLATVVNLFLLLAGGLAINELAVRQYPQTQNSVITVQTVYPGASADLIQGYITTPLEREISSADGIDYLESVSAPNYSIIKANLRLNYDVNAALTQITSKVNRVRSELPLDAEDPIFDTATGDATASMYLSFASDQLTENELSDYLVRVVQPKLVTVPGVQKAEIMGARTFAMRIWLKPDKMAALNLSPAQVRQLLSAQNYLSAIGTTKGEMTLVNLTARTDLHDPAEFRDIVLLERNGETVRLGDIADVELGAESYDATVTMNGENATFIAISSLPTANPLQVVARLREAWPAIVDQLPAGVHAKIAYDATEFINDSIREVAITLIEAVCIVVVVIFLFLGSFRSVFIPVVAIPLSLLGCTVLMLAMGFSINLLTLLAMVLAIGLVVDDAIVVVENIHRHIEEGLSPLDAALKGAHELVGPIIAMTITLAAVYAPIGLQGGVTGALFREFAFTLAGSVIVSGFVALTLSPMICSKILRHARNPRGLEAFLDRTFDKFRNTYERTLAWVLRTRPAIYIVAILVLASIVPFYLFTPSELAPTEDQGFIAVIKSGPANSSLEQALEYVKQVDKEIADTPESDIYFTITGFDIMTGIPSASSGFTGVGLKPWSARTRSAAEIAADLSTRVSHSVTGLNVFAPQLSALPGGDGLNMISCVIVSTDDYRNIYEVSNDFMAKAYASGLFMYVDNNLKIDQPQTEIVIDRDKAAALGITMQQIAGDMGSMLGGGYVNRFSIQGRAYKVTPQVSRQYRLNAGQLNNYYIATGSGELVPFSTVATLQDTTQPRSLNRFQQLNAATLTLMPTPGVAKSDAMKWVEQEASRSFPQGYTYDYKGEARQFVQEGSNLMITFALALVVIFLVLAAQYESFRDPFVIMMTVPLAIAGALAFLFMGFATLNIYTQVGLLTLIGLITKHGILIVQFANQMQTEGMPKAEAIQHAAGVRLRPILMTTAAMVLGVLPLLWASGAGAESRFSMGLVIATGMTIGTFFTLFVVPTFYMLVGHDAQKQHAKKTAKEALAHTS